MVDCAPNATLVVLKDKSHDSKDTLVDATCYRSIVGPLQYLIFTQPHIYHPVNRVCKIFNIATDLCIGVVKAILLRYLKETQEYDLQFIS